MPENQASSKSTDTQTEDPNAKTTEKAVEVPPAIETAEEDKKSDSNAPVVTAPSNSEPPAVPAADQEVHETKASVEDTEEDAKSTPPAKSAKKPHKKRSHKKGKSHDRRTKKTALVKPEDILVVGVIHADWCGHCIHLMGDKEARNFKPTIWKNAKKHILAKKPKKVEVVFIEIESKELHTVETLVNEKYHVKLTSKGYPTLFKIWDGKLDQEFNMDRTQANIAKWALEGIHAHRHAKPAAPSAEVDTKEVTKMVTKEDTKMDTNPQSGGVVKKFSRKNKKGCGCKKWNVRKTLKRWFSF